MNALRLDLPGVDNGGLLVLVLLLVVIGVLGVLEARSCRSCGRLVERGARFYLQPREGARRRLCRSCWHVWHGYGPLP